MDIKIEKKKYIIPKKYWGWTAGGTVIVAALVWLATGNFASTLKVERRGLSIGKVERKEFNDYVSVDGQVVPIQVVQVSPEEGGIVRTSCGGRSIGEEGRRTCAPLQHQSRPRDTTGRKRTRRKAEHAPQYAYHNGAGQTCQRE